MVDNEALDCHPHSSVEFERGNIMKSINMRRLGVRGLWVAVFLACVGFGCGSPAAGEPDGFRGVKWSAGAASVPGIDQVAGEGDLLLYEKNDDQLQMGDVKLDRVIYGFYKDRFYMGMAYFPADGFEKVAGMLKNQLGQPAKPENTSPKLIWDGDNVSVLLTMGESPDQGRLVYLYKPIQLEVELKK
jgi:hypothetical protein